MTRKDYQVIANAISSQVFSEHATQYELDGVVKVARAIARSLERENTAFDFHKFEAACGVSLE